MDIIQCQRRGFVFSCGVLGINTKCTHWKQKGCVNVLVWAYSSKSFTPDNGSILLLKVKSSKIKKIRWDGVFTSYKTWQKWPRENNMKMKERKASIIHVELVLKNHSPNIETTSFIFSFLSFPISKKVLANAPPTYAFIIEWLHQTFEA